MQINNILITVSIISLISFFACSHHHDEEKHKSSSHREDKTVHERHEKHEKHDEQDSHAGHDEDAKHGGHENHEGHDHKADRSRKAVTEADENRGIRLSPEAEVTIGLKKLPLNRFRIGKRKFTVPAAALVRHEFNRSCFLQRGHWYRPERVRVLGRRGNNLLVEIPGAKSTDSLVTTGAPLLRLAQLEAFGASGHGHGH